MLKTKQLSDLEGAAEDLKNKAMILQTGIDLQALWGCWWIKGLSAGKRSGNTGMKYRAVRSGALR